MKKSNKYANIKEKTLAAAKKQQQASASPWNKATALPKGVELFLPKEGKVSLRVLPYTQTDPRNNPDSQDKGELWFKRRYWAHRGIGPEELTVVCPLKSFGHPCPVCEAAAKMRKDEDADEEVARALGAKERELYAVLAKGADKVQIIDQSTYMFGDLLTAEVLDDENDAASFWSPVDGLACRMRFKKKAVGKGTAIALESVSFVRDDDVPEEILEKVPDLDALLIELTYDELSTILNGGPSSVSKKSLPKDEDEDEDDEDEEPAKPAKKSKAPAKKPIEDDDGDEDDEDDEDDEEDDEDDEDDDEDEEPVKKAPAKSKAKAKVEDEDDDDEDDEDDDDGDDDDEDDDDDDEDDEDDDEEPVKKAPAKSKAKAKVEDDDDEDDEDDEDDDDDDDGDEDDDDDGDEDEDDEEPVKKAPAKKTTSKKK